MIEHSEQIPRGWYKHRDTGCSGIWHVASMEPEQHLAVIGTAIMGDKQAEAVATLMAVAPEMYTALLDAPSPDDAYTMGRKRWMDWYYEWFEQCMAAITKAKGKHE